MSPGDLSFFIWCLVIVAVLVGMLFVARRSKSIDRGTEDIASKALPEIGEIAEKKHVERFGRAPTNVPQDCTWYPETKKKIARGSAG